jgi:hypothetical protein
MSQQNRVDQVLSSFSTEKATTGRSSLRSIADVHRRLSANTDGRSRGRSLHEVVWPDFQSSSERFNVGSANIYWAVLWPLAAEAQQGGKVYRIGYLSTPTRAAAANGLQAFLRALQELTPISLHRHACSEVRNRRYSRRLLAAQSNPTHDLEAICPD